jgi:hypothetical protein
LVKSEHQILASKALQYFVPIWIIDPEIQKELALEVKEASAQIKFEIVWAFSSIPLVSDEAMLILLKACEARQINSGLLGYVVKLIRSEHMKNNSILQKVRQYSSDENLYVRNMMQNVLKEKLKK